MVIVTGATGHIGNVLVRQLIAKGEKVRVLILCGEDESPIEGLDVEKVYGNICDLKSLIKAFSGVDIVYHLAGLISISSGNSKALEKVNIEGTQNVVDACLNLGIKRLVYTSSVHAFAEPPFGKTMDEDTPLNPTKTAGEYGCSKAKATLKVIDGIDKGLDAIIVFPSGVIGPYDFKVSEIGSLIIDYTNKKLKAYIGGMYNYVDVRDVAEGIILAGEKGRKGEKYILSGENISVEDMLLEIKTSTGIEMPSFKAPYWMAYTGAFFSPLYCKITKTRPRFTTYTLHVLKSNSMMSHEKASKELGYSPRPIRQSISDSVKWFWKNGKIVLQS